MQGQLGQGEFTLRRAEVLVGLPGGVGQDKRHGIRRADILHGGPDQPAGDEERLLTALEHAGEPVQGGVGIGAPYRLVKGGDEVVVPLAVLVVGRAALLQQAPEGGGVEGRGGAHAEKRLGKGQQIAAIPIRQGDQGGTGRPRQRKRPALSGLGAAQEGLLSGFVQPPQDEDLASGQEGPIQLERRVLRSRPDQGDHPLLHPGQEAVLLGPVETVNLIHEQEGGLSRLAPKPGLLEGLLQVRDAGEDGGDLLELVAGRLGQQPGDGGLADPGRAPEHHGGQPATGRHPPDRPLGRQEVVLACDLAERTGPQALRQRRGVGRRQARSFEQVGHAARLTASRGWVRSGNWR